MKSNLDQKEAENIDWKNRYNDVYKKAETIPNLNMKIMQLEENNTRLKHELDALRQ